MSRIIRSSLVAAAVIIGGSACSSDDSTHDESQMGPAGAPTKELVAEEAGLAFPDSVSLFRLTSVQQGQIDITFQMANDDIEAFETGSDITLEPYERAIAHSSPLWGTPEYATLEFSGSVTTHNGVVRSVEVFTNPATGDTAPADSTTTSEGGYVPPTTAPLDPNNVTVRISLSNEAAEPGDGEE